MLKGLEISEVKLSEIDTIQYRFDAEFYSKQNLLLDKFFDKAGYVTLNLLKCKIDCSAFYPGITQHYDFNGNGIPFIRVNEIQNGFVKITENTAFLPAFVIEENSNTIAKAYPNDIVIAKGGNTLGKVGILTNEYSEYAICRDVLLIRTDNLLFNQKYSIWAYLHSNFGYRQMIKTASQTGQPHLTVPNSAELKMPKWIETNNRFSESYLKAQKLLFEARKIYAEAEEILLSELSLKDWKPNNENVSVKRLSDFASSGRLDAEYYQIKYDEIENKIKSSSYDLLSNVMEIKDKNFNPAGKAVYKYIELANIGSAGEITGFTEDFGENLPGRARRLVHTGDLLISSIEGSLQSCAIITEDYDNALCSTGFYVVSPKMMNVETLLVLLKSDCIQSLLKRGCSGTILTSIAKDELSKILLPIISGETQELIAEKIQESFILRAESKQLLEQAKRMVEDKIEK